MPAANPEISQWIRQMGDRDQVVAYFAYQSLLELVLHSSAPERGGEQSTVAAALGEALTLRAAPRQGAGGQPAPVSGNPFLAAVARQAAAYQHPARVRSHLARLLGYLPVETAVPYLAKALEDLEAREMARCSLESNPSEAATDALIGALDSTGATFCAGTVNALARKKGDRVEAALRKAAEDPQEEVRIAALYALADRPEPAHDAILDRASRSASAAERRVAHVSRARLVETLCAAGEKQAAERIAKSILASGAPDPQKRAARLALGG
jgi:HEAT repeat protein